MLKLISGILFFFPLGCQSIKSKCDNIVQDFVCEKHTQIICFNRGNLDEFQNEDTIFEK